MCVILETINTRAARVRRVLAQTGESKIRRMAGVLGDLLNQSRITVATLFPESGTAGNFLSSSEAGETNATDAVSETTAAEAQMRAADAEMSEATAAIITQAKTVAARGGVPAGKDRQARAAENSAEAGAVGPATNVLTQESPLSSPRPSLDLHIGPVPTPPPTRIALLGTPERKPNAPTGYDSPQPVASHRSSLSEATPKPLGSPLRTPASDASNHSTAYFLAGSSNHSFVNPDIGRALGGLFVSVAENLSRSFGGVEGQREPSPSQTRPAITSPPATSTIATSPITTTPAATSIVATSAIATSPVAVATVATSNITASTISTSTISSTTVPTATQLTSLSPTSIAPTDVPAVSASPFAPANSPTFTLASFSTVRVPPVSPSQSMASSGIPTPLGSTPAVSNASPSPLPLQDQVVAAPIPRRGWAAPVHTPSSSPNSLSSLGALVADLANWNATRVEEEAAVVNARGAELQHTGELPSKARPHTPTATWIDSLLSPWRSPAEELGVMETAKATVAEAVAEAAANAATPPIPLSHISPSFPPPPARFPIPPKRSHARTPTSLSAPSVAALAEPVRHISTTHEELTVMDFEARPRRNDEADEAERHRQEAKLVAQVATAAAAEREKLAAQEEARAEAESRRKEDMNEEAAADARRAELQQAEELSIGHFNATRAMLAEELKILDDEARERRDEEADRIEQLKREAARAAELKEEAEQARQQAEAAAERVMLEAQMEAAALLQQAKVDASRVASSRSSAGEPSVCGWTSAPAPALAPLPMLSSPELMQKAQTPSPTALTSELTKSSFDMIRAETAGQLERALKESDAKAQERMLASEQRADAAEQAAKAAQMAAAEATQALLESSKRVAEALEREQQRAQEVDERAAALTQQLAEAEARARVLEKRLSWNDSSGASITAVQPVLTNMGGGELVGLVATSTVTSSAEGGLNSDNSGSGGGAGNVAEKASTSATPVPRTPRCSLSPTKAPSGDRSSPSANERQKSWLKYHLERCETEDLIDEYEDEYEARLDDQWRRFKLQTPKAHEAHQGTSLNSAETRQRAGTVAARSLERLYSPRLSLKRSKSLSSSTPASNSSGHSFSRSNSMRLIRRALTPNKGYPSITGGASPATPATPFL